MSLVNQPKYDFSIFNQDVEPNVQINGTQTQKANFNASLISNDFATSSVNEITINIPGKYKIEYSLICQTQRLVAYKPSGSASVYLMAGSNVVGASSINGAGTVSPNSWNYSKSYLFSELTGGSSYYQDVPVKTSFTSAWTYEYTGKIIAYGEYILSAGDKIYIQASSSSVTTTSSVGLVGSGCITIQKLY